LGQDNGTPISLPLVKRENSLGESFFQNDRLKPPTLLALPVIRTLVFVRLVIVHLSGTHQSPIRIKAVGTVREEPFPAPGSFEPQKTVGTRSCPIDGP